MSLFHFFKKNNIDKEVELYRKKSSDSILLDVRTKDEFESGHIPGSINLPLDSIEEIDIIVPKKTTKILVYCRSGNRSEQATMILRSLGYKDCKNIGGIMFYHGSKVI